MPAERDQFRSLWRAFTQRFLEHEFLSSGGDIRELFVNLIAVLGALGVCLSYLLISKHGFWMSKLPQQVRDRVAWSDQEFLMSLTIAVAGVFVIVCWDAMFPDRTDCFVLGSLPVPLRTVFAAKLTAIAAVFWLLVAAANAAPLIVFPAIMITTGAADVRPALWFIAQLAAAGGASLFVFAAAAAVQGVLINVLSYSAFRRASSVCQLGAVFVLLAMLLFTPAVAAPEQLADPGNRIAITLIPSFWFLGLYQAILGTTLPVVLWLAKLALFALAAAVGLAALSYTLGYERYVRRTNEDSGLEPPRRPRRGYIRALARRTLVRDSGERAVFDFVWRTMTRSRIHRLIFAGYMSIGVIYVALGVIGLVKARGLDGLMRPGGSAAAAPIVFGFFAMAAMRAAFSFPVDLRANWVFRMMEPPSAVAAVRKLMFVTGVLPAVLFSAAAYPVLWGPARGLRFAFIMLLIEWIILERLMRDFRKIPFTCSYMPGKADLKARFVIYVVLFALIAYIVTHGAAAAVRDHREFLRASVFLAAWLGWKVWRRRKTNAGWTTGLTYEDVPEWKPITLELT